MLDERFNASEIGQYPRFWGRYNELYEFAATSDILGIIFTARKNEIFRRGIAIKPKKGKETTGVEMNHEEPASIITKAWEEAKDDKIESFIKQANANGQSLVQVLKQIEEDLCTVDDAYLTCQFVYEVNDDGTIISKSAKEFFRQDPRNMKIIVDRRNRLGRDPSGERLWFSVNDRSHLVKETEAKANDYKDKKGVKLFPAHYRYDSAGTNVGATGVSYYAPWEVCHASEWNSTLTYSSCPPLLRVWMKIWTLIKMDQYVMQNYALQRPPKFFLVFNTTNSQSLEKEYNKMIQRAQLDPHIPQILANESKESAGGVQMVDLMKPLEEMQFIEVRQEYRQQAGAVWGVMPIWHADVSTSGGLNNEGMQITVTNRAIEDAQSFHNDTYLAFISRSIGVTDRVLELNPSEELDEVAELTRQAMKIQNATAMRSLGFNIHLDENTGEFTFSGQAQPLPAAPSFGGLGDFGGDEGGDDFGGDSNPEDAFPGETGPDNGFDTNPQFSGTTDDEVTQSERKGFRSPASGGEIKQAESPRKVAQRLGLALSDKLLREFEPVLRKLDALAKKDPSAARREVARLARLLSGKIKETSDKLLHKTFVEGQRGVEEEFGFKPSFTGRDQAFVDQLLANPVYNDAMRNLRSGIEKAAYEAIAGSLAKKGSFNLETVREGIRAIGDYSEKEVKTLARTHSNQFFQAGRRSGYKRAEAERGETFKYDWLGPSDARTTDCCKNVKARIDAAGGAVPWEELYAIVNDESRKYFPTFVVEPEAPTAHWNCRHLAVRRVR